MKKLLIVDDEKNMRWGIKRALQKENYLLAEASNGQEAIQQMASFSPDLILLDLKMPLMDGMTALKKMKGLQEEIPVVIMTAHGTIESAIEAMKNGAIDYLSKPFDIEELKIVIEKSLGVSELQKEVVYLRDTLGKNRSKPIIGESPSFKCLLETVSQVAKANATVLLLGESGTGKELIANAIHERSLRSSKNLVKINCGAIPQTLMESELFGFEKGAFTGAVAKKIGKFELAHEGTIFLDEIGELDLSMQVNLLRVLQEKEIQRIGGNRTIQVDTRVIAATNRDLAHMVKKGLFREDLYYRLNVVPLVVPPLRERKEDIPLLIDYFLERFSRECNKPAIKLAPAAQEKLTAYSWRGNVRELENVIERMVILARGNVLDMAQLPKEIFFQEVQPEFTLPQDGISLEELEKSLIRQALERTNFNQTHAARLLGMSRHTLLYRMEKYGIANS